MSNVCCNFCGRRGIFLLFAGSAVAQCSAYHVHAVGQAPRQLKSDAIHTYMNRQQKTRRVGARNVRRDGWIPCPDSIVPFPSLSLFRCCYSAVRYHNGALFMGLFPGHGFLRHICAPSPVSHQRQQQEGGIAGSCSPRENYSKSTRG